MRIKKYIQFIRDKMLNFSNEQDFVLSEQQLNMLEERRSDRMLVKSKTYSLDEVVSSLTEPQVQDQKLIENSDINYLRRYCDDLLMFDVLNEETHESKNEAIERLFNNKWIKDSYEFLESVNKSTKLEFMTPYTADELSEFNLFKLEGFNIGFAVKPDGDIILVHNNENIGGLGKILMEKAIENGGNKLDHFDGYLTGFYRSMNFILDSNEQFTDDLVPEGWKYESVDIDDREKSIYANEIEVSVDEKLDAVERYKSGKPDVVYRKLI